MKLSKIINGIEIAHSDIEDLEIDYVSTDIEKIKERTLFVLENSKKAPCFSSLTKEPSAVICDADIDTGTVLKIIVKDARIASSYIHSNFYGVDYTRLKFIGITGTNGKSTTAYLTYEILIELGFKAGFIGTGRIEINGKAENDKHYSMTTPDPALLYKTIKKMQDAGCTYVIMEISSHALSLNKTAPIIFEYGLFTNLSPEHLDFHKDMENYYSAKSKLAKSSKCAVFNIDDRYISRMCSSHEGRKITVGSLYRGDYYAVYPQEMGVDGISYILHGKSFSFRMRSSLCGIYNVYNTLLAAATLIDIGIAPCRVKTAMKKAKGLHGRYEIIKDEITVIIDYAHTPLAYESFLRSVRAMKGHRKLISVFGCGGEREKEKRPKIAKITEKYSDKIFVTSDNPRGENPETIIEDIIGGFSGKSYVVIKDRSEAIIKAVTESCKNDIVAIIGKGAEEYNIDENGYHKYSDIDVVKTALEERKHHANKA